MLNSGARCLQGLAVGRAEHAAAALGPPQEERQLAAHARSLADLAAVLQEAARATKAGDSQLYVGQARLPGSLLAWAVPGEGGVSALPIAHSIRAGLASLCQLGSSTVASGLSTDADLAESQDAFVRALVALLESCPPQRAERAVTQARTPPPVKRDRHHQGRAGGNQGASVARSACQSACLNHQATLSLPQVSRGRVQAVPFTVESTTPGSTTPRLARGDEAAGVGVGDDAFRDDAAREQSAVAPLPSSLASDSGVASEGARLVKANHFSELDSTGLYVYDTAR